MLELKEDEALTYGNSSLMHILEIGVGREGMPTMCDIFNMPPPCNRSAWNNHINALFDAHKKAVSDNLQKGSDKVKSFHEPKEPGVVEIAVN